MRASEQASEAASPPPGGSRPLDWFVGSLLLIGAVSGGCGSTGTPVGQGVTIGATDLYQVGPLQVLLRPQPEVEFMCRLHAQQRATPSGRILGCYVPRERAIISTPDAQVLLHEFKHYFEGPFHD